MRKPALSWRTTSAWGTFGDICVRDDSRLNGQVDLYTALPPLGRPERRRSEGPRGLAFLRVLETVGKVKPRAFVIENVKGLLERRHIALREHTVTYLQNLRDRGGKRLYKVRMRVLDTQNYWWAPSAPAASVHCRLAPHR